MRRSEGPYQRWKRESKENNLGLIFVFLCWGLLPTFYCFLPTPPNFLKGQNKPLAFTKVKSLFATCMPHL